MKFRWNFIFHRQFTSTEVIFSHPETLRSYSFSKEAFELFFQRFPVTWEFDDFLRWGPQEFANPKEFHEALVAASIIITEKPFRKIIPEKSSDLEAFLTLEELALGARDFSKVKLTSVLREASEEECHFILSPENVLTLASATSEGRRFRISSLRDLRYEKCGRLLLEQNYRSLLDYGCGEGLFYEKVSRMPIRYIGYDSNSELIEKNRQRFQCPEFHSELPRERCDLVVLLEVLEHMEPAEAGKLVRHFLREESDIFLTMPNHDFNQHLPGEFSKRHPEHVHEWSELEFESFLKELVQEGFEVRREDLGRLVKSNRPTLSAYIRSYRERKSHDQFR